MVQGDNITKTCKEANGILQCETWLCAWRTPLEQFSLCMDMPRTKLDGLQ